VISDAQLIAHTRAHEDEIEKLRSLEKAAIAHLQKRTGRYFGPVDEVTEYVQWRGWPMQLANEPVGDLTSFKSWDGSAFSDVDTSSYYVQGQYIYWNTTNWSPLTMPSRYEVVYNAGFETLDDPNETDAPDDIKQAVLLLVGHWNENREAVVVDGGSTPLDFAVDALISPHERVSVG
jgi:uncharacterized phiE125 gp8 family phage protein